jgi:NADPH2:quinone reductase
MSRAIIIKRTGGPEVLEIKQVEDRKPGKGEIAIRNRAIGLNYIDIYQRQGLYPIESSGIIGVEGSGQIEAIGEGVEGFRVGDRVAYGTAPGGAYAERVVLDQNIVCAIPEEVTFNEAAALMCKGLTAHYLLRRTFFLKPENTVLIHSAAGGVGQLLCQWAKAIGAKIIATVGSEDKAQIAKDNGCDYVIIYTQEDFVSRVTEITEGKGVNVVYDAVGRDTFHKSMECLSYFGLMVSYGQSSGPIEPMDLSILAKKSTFLTKPSLFHYKLNRMELILSTNEVFFMLKNGAIKANINNIYQFQDVVEAHRNLEARSTTGASIIVL